MMIYIMPNDLFKLLIVAAVVYAAYHVLVKNGGLIKNDGNLTLNPSLLNAPPGAGSGPVQGQGLGVPNKRVLHNQIDDVAHNEELMNKVKSDQLYTNNSNVLPYPQISNNYAAQGNFNPNSNPNPGQLDCFPKDQLVAQDLLPREGAYAQSNPPVQGHLSNRNFLESGYHAGLNTQSNTLKNANRQLRSDPLIARRDVGPWSQSTYEPDTNRRQFEIGGI